MIDPLCPFDTQVAKKEDEKQNKFQKVEVRGGTIVEVKKGGSDTSCCWGFNNNDNNINNPLELQ